MFQVKELLDDIPEFRTPADGSKQQLLTPISASRFYVVSAWLCFRGWTNARITFKELEGTLYVTPVFGHLIVLFCGS